MKDVKGFLSDKEAKKLQELFLKVHHLGSVLEIGTYCGKSALKFSDIASDYLKQMNYQPYECESESQARELSIKLIQIRTFFSIMVYLM